MLLTKNRLLYRLLTFVVLGGAIFFFYSFYTGMSDEGKVEENYDSYVQGIGLAVVDVNKALDLCSESDKPERQCLKELVRIVVKKDFKKGLDICEGVINPIRREECFFAIAESLFGENDSLAAVSACNELPSELRNNCFTILSTTMSIHFGNNINHAVQACNEFPVEFRDNCFHSLNISFPGLNESVGQRIFL